MITRKEYMKNSSELHHEYYLQFATPASFEFVKSKIGIDLLKKSKDPHLNDIIKRSSCGDWIWDYTPINLEKARQLGETGFNSLPSPSTCTCTGKAVARVLLDQEKGANNNV